MSKVSSIREALERQSRICEERPSAGFGTSYTTVRLRSGLTCEIEQDQWRFVADHPESFGGADRGPDPGLFGRAALGACAAQGYAMWFARLSVPLRGVEVRVESDLDKQGMLATADDVPAGYQAVRLSVRIDSDAEESVIMAALETADRHSPWLYNFVQPLPVTREVTIRRYEG